jgi:threonine dehydratase
MVALPDIQAALGRIRDQIYLSPCARSETLSRATGTHAFLKLENLQMTGAYKERGALNRLLAMAPAERARGLIAASAGNHAQAVAYHGGRLGVTVTIVMPETTPIMKVANTRAHGARVVLHGTNFDEAHAEARRLEQAEGLTFLHPFDDPLVIAGQGTIGLEILDQVPDVDAVVVPVGGGGLISGVAAALKACRPGVRVVGVEAEVIPCMQAARQAGRPVTLAPATRWPRASPSSGPATSPSSTCGPTSTSSSPSPRRRSPRPSSTAWRRRRRWPRGPARSGWRR